MRYKEIQQVPDVALGFVTTETNVYLSRKNNTVSIFEIKDNELKNFQIDFTFLEFFPVSEGKVILTENWAGMGYLYDVNDKIKFIKELGYSIYSICQNKLVANKRIKINNDVNNYIGLYDLSTQKIIWDKERIGMLEFVSDLLFLRGGKVLSRLSIETGEVLWTYSFEGYQKTKSVHRIEENVTLHNSDKAFTGILGNQLWVTLNTWQHLVLDINTGKQLALLGNRYNYNKTYEDQYLAGGGCIDSKNKKIISLGNAIYREIDCTTFEITFYDLSEEFEKHSVNSIGDILIDDDYLYLYDKKFIGINQCCKVAVLDRNTLKVVWVHDFAEYGTFPMQMEKTDRHLFVLDSGGTLHIFERDEVA
jgi:hypothetical protein